MKGEVVEGLILILFLILFLILILFFNRNGAEMRGDCWLNKTLKVGPRLRSGTSPRLRSGTGYFGKKRASAPLGRTLVPADRRHYNPTIL